MAKPGHELPEVRTAPPGPRSRELARRLAAVESPAFDARRSARASASGAEQAPIVYARGEGANVWDADDNRYVDLVAGFGALVLGHRSARVTRAVAEQEAILGLALGDVYASEIKIALCERLARELGERDARVMLGLSGADAVTAALKTAVLATSKPGIVAFAGAYHGLSYAPLAACGLSDAFRAPFAAQLGSHVTFAAYPATDDALDPTMTAVRAALARDDVGAVLVEPILGRGGCVTPPSAFLPELRRECDRTGALLVVDEIWTGLGRSGAWLASRAAGVRADLVCLGKGLGGGVPISACIGSSSAMAAWGAHGGGAIHTATHFGAPPACAAAMATLDALTEARLDVRALAAGAAWMRLLSARVPSVSVRGRGLMVGVGVSGGAGRALAIARALLLRGWLVLTGGARGDVLTLTPPLDIAESLLDAFAEALADAVADVP